MSDVFQFYSSSADAAPGKGTGESLASAAPGKGTGETLASAASATKYADLKKIPNWRRTLATLKSLSKDEVHQNPEATTILPLTQTAELWYAAPRMPKVRSTVLEEVREELAQRNVPKPTEMADVAPKKKTRAKKVQKAGAEDNKPEEAETNSDIIANTVALSRVPEGIVSNGDSASLAQPPLDVEMPDLEVAERQESAIRFCPVCRYYLYLQVSGKDQVLSRVCRNCGHNETDEKGGMVMEMMVKERSAEGYKILLNEFTRQDPRLPHIRKNIKCPEPTCDSNHGKADPDVIYIKYDAVNMLYLYICDVCGFQWRSGR
jgi:DNA-directed RNA polymerase subunit M/transcription elongation factor TFIIS